MTLNIIFLIYRKTILSEYRIIQENLWIKNGGLPAPEGSELTQMGYEFYPEGISHVVRHVAEQFSIPILVTENGIATDDDTRRVEYIRRAVAGIAECVRDGIPVKGYLHWDVYG